MRRATIALVLTGCHSVFGLQHIDDTDAAPGAWSTPQPLTSVNSLGDEADASLTGDGLVLMFSSDRTGNYDFWIATRALVTDPFDTPVRVDELSTPADDFGFLSADGLSAYVNRAGDIWRADRPDLNVPFSAPILESGLSTTATDFNPSVSANGLVAVIDYGVTAFGGELFVSTRATTNDSWSAPQRMAELSSPTIDAGGTFDERGLVIAFHTERVAGFAREIYLASRTSVDEPFAMIGAIDEVNTRSGESDPHITPDARTLVFSRDRDLWISTR